MCSFFVCSLISERERQLRHGRWRGSGVRFPPLLQNGALLDRCLFNEQRISQERGCSCAARGSGFPLFIRPFSERRTLLARSRLEFLGQAKGGPGQDTVPPVLTRRHWLFRCWERKPWKQNTHVCSQEFTLLNKDSADTHRFLSLRFAGCSPGFSAPTKAAVSKQHLSD